MRSLSALLIIGCAAAAATIKPYGWSPAKEYRYEYSSHVLSGIPELNQQYSGVRLTAEVRIQPQHDSTCRIQLEHPRFISYNEVLEEMEHDNVIRSSGQEETIPSEIKSWLEKPFTVFHKRGLVEKLETETGEPEFIVNIKKALTSRIQMDLSKAESRHAQNQVNSGETLPTFTTHESSIMGKCETIYTITRLPEHLIRDFEEKESMGTEACEGKEYYEILKTKNMNKCSEHPAYHWSFGIEMKGSEPTAMPAHSSVTRSIICGSLEDHFVRKVVTENKVITSTTGQAETKETMEISSVSTLNLKSVEGITEEISGPSSPKEHSSLVFEYPSGSPSSSRSLKQEASQQGRVGSHAPLPGLTSVPISFYPRTSSERERKQSFIEAFNEIIEASREISPSSKSEKDVSGLIVHATRFLGQLSLDDLKEIEEIFKSQHGEEKYDSVIEKAFYDLVSMTGTNPCVMLIKEKVLSGKMLRDPASWSWILSNTFRSIKTPTEELLGELVELLKTKPIHEDRVIRAAYVMGLTELINKACVNPETMKTEYPYKIFGQMCNEDMSIIKNDLIPYLTRKLRESSRTDMGSVITYVNALGNLGLEESSRELLEVVEGRISVSPHPRSVAVYKLIRPARQNPSIYKPVFLSLIENSAENPEVRMAAITALTYCSPSTADLQKLAVRTWFEPSRQVSSYIHSTLKTLSQLSGSVPEYDVIKVKAETALPLAKPNYEGYQYSRNLQVVKFFDSLKIAVSNKLAWTASEDSFYPRSTFISANTKGLTGNYNFLESAFYMQGAEDVLDKLYEMYGDFKVNGEIPQLQINKNKREVEEKMSKLDIKSEEHPRPEAFLNVKFLGLQKLWSFDEKYVTDIIHEVSSNMAKYQSQLERGMTYEYFKILDLSGSDCAFPTESGMAAYIALRNPTVSYNKAEIKSEWESVTSPRMEISMKGVTNYKRQLRAGVI